MVLIGSVARKEHKRYSDIDICRINTNIEISKKDDWPKGPVNYVDYDIEEFFHLYNLGSLFIYHILNEGILLKGDRKLWRYYKNNFIFQDRLDEDLDIIKSIISDFLNVNIFGGTFLSLYSNLFVLIKNYSIFTLAKKNIFIFNKEKAVNTVFGSKFYDLLSDSYNYFKRGIPPANDWDYKSLELAKCVLNNYKNIMGDENDYR